MSQLNKNYVEVVEDLTWKDESGKHVEYKLQSSLGDFALGGAAETSLLLIKRNPKTHILVGGLNNIYGSNVEENLPKYELKFKGLLIPEEKFEQIGGLELGLSEVYRTNFRATRVEQGSSFLVKTRQRKDVNARIDYVISPKDKQLIEVLRALDAPSDLLFD